MLHYLWVGTVKIVGGINFSASKLRGAKFQCTEPNQERRVAKFKCTALIKKMQLDVEVSPPDSSDSLFWRASVLTLLNNAKNSNIYILTERPSAVQYAIYAEC